MYQMKHHILYSNVIFFNCNDERFRVNFNNFISYICITNILYPLTQGAKNKCILNKKTLYKYAFKKEHICDFLADSQCCLDCHQSCFN